MIKPKRKVKCVICQAKFERWNTFQKVCTNPECIIENARNERNKANRREKREYNEKDKAYLTKKAQSTFNKYIRKRDGSTCISCGNTTRQIHAGHFKPVGRNHQLRFNEMNCHSQCSICNNHLSGNLVAYREALIALYGEARVQALENSNEVKSYSVEELKEIIETYKKKFKEIS